MKKITALIICVFIATTVFAQFSDTDSHWAYEAIQWASEQKIMNGYPDHSFKPDAFITRAEAIKTISVLYNVKCDKTEFSDVTPNDWFYDYIAYSTDIIPPVTDNVFHPDIEISRQDAVYSIIKAKYGDVTPENPNVLSFYKDGYLVSDYAKNTFAFAKESGIIQGYEDNTLKPSSTITRAEFVTILNNAERKTNADKAPEQNESDTSTDEQIKLVSNFIPVISVGSVENDNGVTVTQINGLKGGKEVSMISTESYENNVKPGDMIIPVINHKGLVKSCYVLATYENNTVTFGKEYMNKTNTSGKKTKYYFGQIENIEKNKYISLKNNAYSSQSYDNELSISGNTEVYFYNTMLKSKNRLYEEALDVLFFENGKAYVNNTEVSAIYIVAREIDGEVSEAGIYIIK